jgi:hypothetical protein
MNKRFIRCVVLGASLLPCARVLPACAQELPAPVAFNRDVRPILAEHCFRCHGPDASHRKAGLRLDLAEGATADLGGRRAVVPGDLDASELMARVTADDVAMRMPPESAPRPLAAREIDILKRWIQSGARYEPHWAFLPPRRPALPEGDGAEIAENPIDRFLNARHQGLGLPAAQPADRVTLARRLYIDLAGMVPTRAEITDALALPAPDQTARLVDRLLASPRFGERMALYWLDLVRYADTVGYHGDQEHHITPYRDYVVRAFNAGMPFDQFTIEQLAGDLLPEATIEQKVASGYNRLLQTSHEGGVQQGEYQAKYDADRVRNLGAVWLGATLGCAECHNHKFDPYTQKDFYSLVAFFADVDDSRTFKGVDASPTKREPEIDVLPYNDRALQAQLRQSAALLEQAVAKAGAGAERGDLERELEAVRRQLTSLERGARRTMITESVAPRVIRVLPRGNWLDHGGEVVEPAVPACLPPLARVNGRATRLDLARWLVNGRHPQTARVFVNRLWALFLGNGLAGSLEDTGAQAEWPAHLDLLDWLASEFVDSHWNVKHVVRLIVTSRAYARSSTAPDQAGRMDPANLHFARQSRWRLPAEALRDSALRVAGLLVERQEGPSALPYQPAGYYRHLNFPKREYRAAHDERQYLRGVYVHWQRQYLHPMLKAFDAPTREECTPQRQQSSTPQAALVLLNDPTFVECARVLAQRAMREAPADDEARLLFLCHEVLLREPSEDERAALRDLLRACRDLPGQNQVAADALLSVGMAPVDPGLDRAALAQWAQVARVLLNLSQFVTRR